MRTGKSCKDGLGAEIHILRSKWRSGSQRFVKLADAIEDLPVDHEVTTLKYSGIQSAVGRMQPESIVKVAAVGRVTQIVWQDASATEVKLFRVEHIAGFGEIIGRKVTVVVGENDDVTFGMTQSGISRSSQSGLWFFNHLNGKRRLLLILLHDLLGLIARCIIDEHEFSLARNQFVCRQCHQTSLELALAIFGADNQRQFGTVHGEISMERLVLGPTANDQIAI